MVLRRVHHEALAPVRGDFGAGFVRLFAHHGTQEGGAAAVGVVGPVLGLEHALVVPARVGPPRGDVHLVARKQRPGVRHSGREGGFPVRGGSELPRCVRRRRLQSPSVASHRTRLVVIHAAVERRHADAVLVLAADDEAVLPAARRAVQGDRRREAEAAPAGEQHALRAGPACHHRVRARLDCRNRGRFRKSVAAGCCSVARVHRHRGRVSTVRAERGEHRRRQRGGEERRARERLHRDVDVIVSEQKVLAKVLASLAKENILLVGEYIASDVVNAAVGETRRRCCVSSRSEGVLRVLCLCF